MHRGRGEKIKCGEYEKQYGFELSVIRQRKGYTAVQVAKVVNVSVQQYCKYESGVAKVGVGTEQKIANFFGMTRSELVKKIEEQIEINKKII